MEGVVRDFRYSVIPQVRFWKDAFVVHPLLYTRSYSKRHVSSLRMIVDFVVVHPSSLFAYRVALFTKKANCRRNFVKLSEAIAF